MCISTGQRGENPGKNGLYVLYSLRKEMIEQENSLKNARASLEQFDKEEQAKLNRAKQEKTAAWIIAGLLLCVCIGK